MASRLCFLFQSQVRRSISCQSITRYSMIPSLVSSATTSRLLDSSIGVDTQFNLSRLCYRYLSTARRQPVKPRTVDIGARARQLQNKRLWTYGLTFSCIAGFIIIVISNFEEQMTFYITPSDAMEKFAANPNKNRFRLGGLVVEGSVAQPATSPEMEFVVTDLITDILVKYEGSLPDLFREGHSVVVEGFLRPFTDEIRGNLSGKAASDKARSVECYFKATEVLAKHDEKYMPAEVAAALERNKAKLEAESGAEESSPK